jgi:F420H(2)-dependent biliverdin reductase
MSPMATTDRHEPDDALAAFWRERHLCSLTTLRGDGSPHVVPVGVTFDPETGTARVITSGRSRKAAHVRAGGDAGARVAVCQVDGRRWSTLEGRAWVRDDPQTVRDAEIRYAQRYRIPRPNPDRVVIVIRVTRRLGTV